MKMFWDIDQDTLRALVLVLTVNRLLLSNLDKHTQHEWIEFLDSTTTKGSTIVEKILCHL